MFMGGDFAFPSGTQKGSQTAFVLGLRKEQDGWEETYRAWRKAVPGEKFRHEAHGLLLS